MARGQSMRPIIHQKLVLQGSLAGWASARLRWSALDVAVKSFGEIVFQLVLSVNFGRYASFGAAQKHKYRRTFSVVLPKRHPLGDGQTALPLIF